jgi:hypothetical protein
MVVAEPSRRIRGASEARAELAAVFAVRVAVVHGRTVGRVF